MRRAIVGLLVLLAGAVVVYGYTMTRRERMYRQYILEGDLAAGRGETFAALSAFSDAIGLKPGSMLGYLKRGEVRYRRGELEAAAQDLSTASDKDATATRALELRGDVDLARQLADRAAEHYTRYVTLDDRSPGVLYKLGLARLLGGRTREAAEALTRATSLDNRLAEAQYLLGVCLRELQRPQDAQRALERAIALNASLLAAREQLADLYSAAGNHAGMIQQLEALFQSDPRPRRQISLAAAYAQANLMTRAVRLLGNAVERYPDDGDAYMALGRMWLDVAKAGQDRIALGKAIEALQHAASMEPTSDALSLLGEARMTASDLMLAERTLQQAAQKLPVAPVTFLKFAEASERLAHIRAARSALLDYYSLLDPSDRKAHDVARRISELSARLGEERPASEWALRAK